MDGIMQVLPLAVADVDCAVEIANEAIRMDPKVIFAIECILRVLMQIDPRTERNKKSHQPRGEFDLRAQQEPQQYWSLLAERIMVCDLFIGGLLTEGVHLHT